MQFQKSTDLAIRILHHLYNYTPRGDAPTAQSIAEATGITYPYFIKLAGLLRNYGLLKAVQGRNGGYKLGKNAWEISLYDVVLAIEGELQIYHRFKEEPKEACDMYDFFRDMQGTLVYKLASTNITDFKQISR